MSEIVAKDSEVQNTSDGSDLPDNLNEAQKRLLSGKTPQRFIKQRQGPMGKTLDYVEVHYVRNQLNKIFGHNWDEEIIDKEIGNSHVIVHVRLNVRVAGQEVTKDGIGSDDITTYKDSSKPVSPGDDVKSAVADGLKKAASKIGIAEDVYWQNKPTDRLENGNTQDDSGASAVSGRKGRANQGQSTNNHGQQNDDAWERYRDDDGFLVTDPEQGDNALHKKLEAVVGEIAEEIGAEQEKARSLIKDWIWENRELEHEKSFANITPKCADWIINNDKVVAQKVKEYWDTQGGTS